MAWAFLRLLLNHDLFTPLLFLVIYSYQKHSLPLVVVCYSSFDAWEPGDRKGSPLHFTHQIHVDEPLVNG